MVVLMLLRYQLDWAGPQFNSMSVDQHVQFAMTRQRDQVAGYLKGGGLPPVFGEYALAGVLRALTFLYQRFTANEHLRLAWPRGHPELFGDQNKADPSLHFYQHVIKAAEHRAGFICEEATQGHEMSDRI